MIGLKSYHIYSNEQPTFQSSITGFTPEWMWKLADELGLVIMLHMVKSHAIAELENQQELQQLCTKYPRVKLILAHCARSFHAPDAANGLSSLRGLNNVWFDMSGVCEAEAIKAILREFGPTRIMWGSDFPVSEIRGKSVTAGDGFAWLDEESFRWDRDNLANPWLVGLESLRALRTAADDFGLNQADVR